MKQKRLVGALTGIGLSLFMIITLFMSTSILLDLFGIREQEGRYVPMVVWSNFLCGWLYLLALYGLFMGKKWSFVPLLVAGCILIGAFFGLYIHIVGGGPYESKTVVALALRVVLTILFALGAYSSTKGRS